MMAERNGGRKRNYLTPSKFFPMNSVVLKLNGLFVIRKAKKVRYAEREWRYSGGAKRRFDSRFDGGGSSYGYGGRGGDRKPSYGRSTNVVDGRHSFPAPAALNYNQMPSAGVVGGQTHGPVNYLPPSFSYPPQPPVAPKVFSGPCYKCKKFGHKVTYMCTF